MKLKLNLLAICLIIASFWGYAEALKCYQCTSAYDPACGENFKKDEVHAFDCALTSPPRYLLNILGVNNRNATGCMKHVRTLNGKTNIERACFYGSINNKTIGCSQDPSLSISAVQVSCEACEANSMHCWKCKSSTNNNCGQYFIPDNIQSEDCEQQFRTNLASRSQIIRGCMRIIQKNGSVIRSCFFGKDSSKDKCNRILNEDGSSIENVINCDICAENYCNNSPSFTTNSILVLTTGLAIFLSLLYTI